MIIQGSESDTLPGLIEAKKYGNVLSSIRATSGKGSRGVPGYSRWVNRPLGARMTALAAVWGMTANQLTAINAVIIFPVLLFLPVLPLSPATSVPAGILLLAGYVLDSGDGQLARFQGGGTKAGKWLDHVSDALKTALFHAVLAIVWFQHYELGNAAWLLVPLAFGVVHSTFFFSIMLADDLRRGEQSERGTAKGTHRSLGDGGVLLSLVKLPNDWGVMCITLMLLPAQWTFMALYTLLLAANVVFLVAGGVRWYRELAVI